MTKHKGEPAVQIWYGMHLGTPGAEPLLIGAGSWEDLNRLQGEAAAIDAEGGAPAGQVTRAGTRHVLMGLGQLAGVEEVTVAALDHYDQLVGASRDAYRQRLKDGAEPEADDEPQASEE